MITKLRRLNLIITYYTLIAYNVVLEFIVQNNTSTFCVLQECVSFRTTQAPPPLLYMNVRCCACKIWAKWHIVIFLLLVFMYDVMKMYVWNVALIAKLYSCVHAALTAKLWKFSTIYLCKIVFLCTAPEKATANWWWQLVPIWLVDPSFGKRKKN